MVTSKTSVMARDAVCIDAIVIKKFFALTQLINWIENPVLWNIAS